jgi:hypothetical protein
MSDLAPKLGESLILMFTNPEPSVVAAKVSALIIGMFIFCVILYLIITYSLRATSRDPRVVDANIAATLALRSATLDSVAKSGQNSLYGSLINTLAVPEQYLVNLCPLTASVGGYIGPLVSGVFNADYYLRTALRAGIRSFFIPISVYYDDNKNVPNWPKSRSPAIVCRDANGIILSLNGLTLQSFCESLVKYKATNVTQAEEPILLFLHGVEGHIPDSSTSEKEYVQFTSDMAKSLQSLQPYRLTTIGGYGSAVGGKRQGEILTQIHLSELRNKILIFTNFNVDVSIKDAYKSFEPKLYNYVNFVYSSLGSEGNQGNLGTLGNTPRSFSIHRDIGGKTDWTGNARISWYSTSLDDPLSVPDASSVNKLTTTGIQCIPLPFISVDSPVLDDIYKSWKGYAWIVKPESARYTKPAPIVPQSPSTAMNARVSPELQPGQTKIT